MHIHVSLCTYTTYMHIYSIHMYLWSFSRISPASSQVQRFLSQPFFVAEIFTGTPGAFVDLETTCHDDPFMSSIS